MNHKQILMFSAILCLEIFVSFHSVAAWDLSSFSYSPPTYEFGKELIARIPAQGLTRARVLLVSDSGYRSIPMERAGDMFTAPLEFGNFAVAMYSFQVATDSGELFETKSYTIRQPSSSEAEARIAALDKEAEREQAKVNQMENAIFSLKNANPAELGKQKGRELAKALVALGKQERKLQEISEQGRVAAGEYAKAHGIQVSAASITSARTFVQAQGLDTGGGGQ